MFVGFDLLFTITVMVFCVVGFIFSIKSKFYTKNGKVYHTYTMEKLHFFTYTPLIILSFVYLGVSLI